jgi:hypothetical protein
MGWEKRQSTVDWVIGTARHSSLLVTKQSMSLSLIV